METSGRMQRPPELVPIPEYLRKVSESSGKLLHFGKIPKKFGLKILRNFDQIFSGFFQNAATFRSFPKPSGGTQGSVPVPADAACAQMPTFLAHAAALGLKPAALRDVGLARRVALAGVRADDVEDRSDEHPRAKRGPVQDPGLFTWGTDGSTEGERGLFERVLMYLSTYCWCVVVGFFKMFQD